MIRRSAMDWFDRFEYGDTSGSTVGSSSPDPSVCTLVAGSSSKKAAKN
jgi:hypothetical protein